MIYENDVLEQHQINLSVDIMEFMNNVYTSDDKLTHLINENRASFRIYDLFTNHKRDERWFDIFNTIPVKYKWHQSTWLLAFLVDINP